MLVETGQQPKQQKKLVIKGFASASLRSAYV